MSWRKGKVPDRKIWTRLRQQLLDRDGWACRTCGRRGRMEVDHVRPLSDGGDMYSVGNLQTLCRACHIRKTRIENTARMEYIIKPELKAWRDFIAERMA